MKVYSVTIEGGGCDPEYTIPVLYSTHPDVDEYDYVQSWEVEEGDLFALFRKTARCCGEGMVLVAVSTDRAMIENQAVVLCAVHEAPLTDCDSEHSGDPEWEAPASHFVLPVEVEL